MYLIVNCNALLIVLFGRCSVDGAVGGHILSVPNMSMKIRLYIFARNALK
jgi:hypothetical protein